MHLQTKVRIRLAQLQGREEGSDGRRLLMLIVRHRHGREHGRSAGTRYAGRAYYGRGQCSPTWGRCSPTWGHGWPACNPTPRLALPACNPNGAPPPTVRGLLWGLHQVHCAAQIVLRMRVRPHSQAQGEKLLILESAALLPPSGVSAVSARLPFLRARVGWRRLQRSCCSAVRPAACTRNPACDPTYPAAPLFPGRRRR